MNVIFPDAKRCVMSTGPKELQPITVGGQDGDLRSRYSGCVLNYGEMVITLISQGAYASSMGHSVIAFEWRDDGIWKNGGSPYRKHKAFHLYPAVLATSVWEIASRAGDVAPGQIQRTRGTYTSEGGVPKSSDKYKRGSDIDAASRVLTYNATYRSWAVDFEKGWKAFLKAKADWKKPPAFNIANSQGGYSCAGWALEVAAVAGIDPGSSSYLCGFPWPVGVVKGGFPVPDSDPGIKMGT